MSKNKHTPGPWAVVKLSGNGGPISIRMEFDGVKTFYGVRSIYRESDARLIAAAPEMMEALKEALENWDDDHFDEEYPYRIEWADKARAVIAKAEEQS